MHPIIPYSSSAASSSGFNLTCPSSSFFPDSDTCVKPLTGEELSEYFQRKAGPEFAAFAIGRLFSGTSDDFVHPITSLKTLCRETKQWLKEEGFNLNRGIGEKQSQGFLTPLRSPLQHAIIKQNLDVIDHLLQRVMTVGQEILLMNECLHEPLILKKILGAKKTHPDDIIAALDEISDQYFYPERVKLLSPFPESTFKILRAALKAIPTNSPCLYHLPISMLKRLKTRPRGLINFLFDIALRGPGRLSFSTPIKAKFGSYTATVHAAINGDYDIVRKLVQMGARLSPGLPTSGEQISIPLHNCPFYHVIKNSPDHDIVDFMIEEDLKYNFDNFLGYFHGVAYSVDNKSIIAKLKAIRDRQIHDMQQSLLKAATEGMLRVKTAKPSEK